MNELSLVAWGPLALFTRPETRADRVSYPILTPCAARGICSAILFKPEMEWDILQIAVLRPWWKDGSDYPQMASIKRNEVKDVPAVSTLVKQPKRLPSINVCESRTQRQSLLLKDVAFMFTVRPVVVSANGGRNTEQKYIDMLQRRLEIGQFFHKPYFGCREFACDVRLPNGTEQPLMGVNMDCGLMIHHLDYSQHPPVPSWFHAVIRNGVLNCDTPLVEV